MSTLGFVRRVTDILGARPEAVTIQVIDDVEPNPELTTVRAGAARMREFDPDTIIGLGGGSPMDAAKIMWLMYEHPEIEFADTKEKFFDIRKRAFTFPGLGEKAQMVAVPTTSGTGSEVTPFAVISDPKAAQKYPLADYALTPNVATVDPVLPMKLPATVTADSGFDALTHATEAYVSVYANDYTDGLCLQAIKLIFENLERCVVNGAGDPEAREKMHNASTVAGMAFANAFLGLVHAMAHTLGNTFHVSHGRTNALLLPHVIRHNGSVTGKATPWPKAEVYRAPERFHEVHRVPELVAREAEAEAGGLRLRGARPQRRGESALAGEGGDRAAPRGVGEQPQCAVQARLAGAVRARDHVQAAQGDGQFAQGAVVLDCQGGDHRSSLAPGSDNGRGKRAFTGGGRRCPSPVPPSRAAGPADGPRAARTWPG